MTNELEKKFFDTFGIEPKKQCYYWDYPYSTGNIVNDTAMNERDCNSCKNPDKEIYPQITDRILLELICILNNYGCTSFAGNFEQLKNEVLFNSIMCCEDTDDDTFQHQVRTLFEES